MLLNERPSADPFKQSLMSSIGDSKAGEIKGRINRINTTEEIEPPSELKSELGRQTSVTLVEDYQVVEGPWDEKFFKIFEHLLCAHVEYINAKGELS
jgi:hypothetical protein